MTELKKMISLIERMEKPKTGWEVLLESEELDERELVSVQDYYDMLDQMEDEAAGKKVTIGYVTKANLNIPQVKRRNPETNRMKNYDDWETFTKELGEQDEVAGVIGVTSFQVNWMPRKKFGDFYRNYKDNVNNIRSEYGLEPVADKGGYSNTPDYGNGGVSTYAGNKESLAGNSYVPMQNVAKSKKKRTYYLIKKDGHIGRPIDKEQLMQYFKGSSEVSGVAALRKMGVEEEKIQEYIKRMKDLNVLINNFETSKVLYISTTVNGIPKTFINDKLNTNIGGVEINPTDFRKIAEERYKKDVPVLTQMTDPFNNVAE